MTETTKAFLVGSDEKRGLFSRSAFRAWIAAALTVVVTAWSAGDPIVEAVRESAPALLGGLLAALGLHATTGSAPMAKKP